VWRACCAPAAPLVTFATDDASSSTAAASLQLHQEANLMREAIMDHHWSSLVIIGHQWSSMGIIGHQWSSSGEPWLPQPSVPPPLRAPP
jgi:hypothetical protein